MSTPQAETRERERISKTSQVREESNNVAVNHAAIIVHDDSGDEGSPNAPKDEDTVEATGCLWLIFALQDPSVMKRRNTFLVAFFLFAVGLTLVILGGIGLAPSSALHKTYISFFVIGFICLIPGGYYMYVLIKVLRKVPGFTLEEVPTYE